MIDFRYHVVSIVAVFLALALGLFLGSTTLQGTVLDNLKGETNKTADENNRLRAQVDDLRTQVTKAQAFVSAVEPYAVAGRLSGQSVVVLSAPGVDDGMRKNVESALADAGATVSADIRLNSAWTDPQQDSLLGALATRLAGGTALPAGTGGERAAAQLASVLAAKPRGRAASGNVADTVAAYSEAGLLTAGSLPPHPGVLAVVLAAAAKSTSRDADVLDLARAFGTAAAGAVLAAGADGGPVLATARTASTVAGHLSTVDSVDDGRGQVALVFALADAEAGRSGNYGSGTDARAPLPTPSATR